MAHVVSVSSLVFFYRFSNYASPPFSKARQSDRFSHTSLLAIYGLATALLTCSSLCIALSTLSRRLISFSSSSYIPRSAINTVILLVLQHLRGGIQIRNSWRTIVVLVLRTHFFPVTKLLGISWVEFLLQSLTGRTIDVRCVLHRVDLPLTSIIYVSNHTYTHIYTLPGTRYQVCTQLAKTCFDEILDLTAYLKKKKKKPQ